MRRKGVREDRASLHWGSQLMTLLKPLVTYGNMVPGGLRVLLIGPQFGIWREITVEVWVNNICGNKFVGTLRKINFYFLSHLMGYDHGDCFPFAFEPNWIPFGSKSKGKLSPGSYPIQCERKWKFSFLRVCPKMPQLALLFQMTGPCTIRELIPRTYTKNNSLLSFVPSHLAEETSTHYNGNRSHASR